MGEQEKFVVAVTVVLEVPVEAIGPDEAKKEVLGHLDELVKNQYHVTNTIAFVHRAI